MIFRSAAADDVPALSVLGRESFLAKFGHLYRPEDVAEFLEETFSEQAIAAELANPNRIYRLAESAEGALAGYCKIALSTSFAGFARGRRAMELKQLYTHPEATGHGIGTQLMDWAMAEFRARGADEIHLSVFSENEGAQRFYARYGFAKLADIVFMVGSHEDHDLLYSLRLD